MKRVILLRHTLTDYNLSGLKGRICGFSDPPLNPEGLKEAQQLRNLFLSIPVEKIYTSPLKRANETARIIFSQRNIPIQTSHNLIEINYGDWEGLTKEELTQKYKNEYEQFLKNPCKWHPRSGESPKDCVKRVDEWLQEVDVELCIAVTHKTVIRLLLCKILEIPIRYYRHYFDIKIGGVSVIIYRSLKWRVETINYAANKKRVFGL